MTQRVLPWAFCPLVADRGCASVLGHRASWPVMKSTGFRVRKFVSRAVSLLSLAVRSLANLSQARFLLPPHLRPASPCTPSLVWTTAGLSLLGFRAIISYHLPVVSTTSRYVLVTFICKDPRGPHGRRRKAWPELEACHVRPCVWPPTLFASLILCPHVLHTACVDPRGHQEK